MRISVVVATHKGNVRGNNEDNFYYPGSVISSEQNSYTDQIEYDTDNRMIFGVFDGMGGLNNGEVASGCAVDQFRIYDEKTDTRSLDELLIEVNQCICKIMAGSFDKIGSTAVVISIKNGQYEVANLGDSRCYLLRDGIIKQLTEDHTQAALLKKIGLDTDGRAVGSNMNNVLTQYLGIPCEEFQIEPYTIMGNTETKDLFLLCSDGLTGMVSEEDILKILSGEYDLKRKRDLLLKRALENGGNDNITIILLQIG